MPRFVRAACRMCWPRCRRRQSPGRWSAKWTSRSLRSYAQLDRIGRCGQRCAGGRHAAGQHGDAVPGGGGRETVERDPPGAVIHKMHHLIGCPHICADVVAVGAADGNRPGSVDIHGRRGRGVGIGELYRQQRPLFPCLNSSQVTTLACCGGGGFADAKVGFIKGVINVIRDQRPLNARVAHHMKGRFRAWGVDAHHLLAQGHQRACPGRRQSTGPARSAS